MTNVPDSIRRRLSDPAFLYFQLREEARAFIEPFPYRPEKPVDPKTQEAPAFDFAIDKSHAAVVYGCLSAVVDSLNVRIHALEKLRDGEDDTSGEGLYDKLVRNQPYEMSPLVGGIAHCMERLSGTVSKADEGKEIDKAVVADVYRRLADVKFSIEWGRWCLEYAHGDQESLRDLLWDTDSYIRCLYDELIDDPISDWSSLAADVKQCMEKLSGEIEKAD